MLLCFTFSHRTADFDLLGQLERSVDDISAALGADVSVAGSVVLATCNRFEAYLDVDESVGVGAKPAPSAQADTTAQTDGGMVPVPAGAGANADAAIGGDPVPRLRALIAEASGIPTGKLISSSETFFGDLVAGHLFSVSSGLESVVVGEGEIAGQVRRAYTAARDNGTVTRDLTRLFQEASRASRGVKNSTGLTTAGRSLVRLALDLAESRFASWGSLRVLLVGTGQYAAASLAAVRDKGVRDIAVYSRTGRAHNFARSHGVAAISTASLAEAVADADLVVSCTVAPGLVLDSATVRQALELRSRTAAGSSVHVRDQLSSAVSSTGPDVSHHSSDGVRGVRSLREVPARADASCELLLVDLGLPRNIEESCGDIPGVELLDLATISLHAPLEELQAADAARSIVAGAAAEFAAKTAEREIEPALVALRQHVFGILDSEISRVASRDENGQLAAALRHFTGVLLHQPSVRARELAREGAAAEFVSAVEALLGVTGMPKAAGDAGRQESPDTAGFFVSASSKVRPAGSPGTALSA